MMFMSSSGSFTCRSALRTDSSLSATGAVIDNSSRYPNLVGRVSAHQAMSLARHPGVHPARHRQYPRNAKQPRQPALSRQEAQDFRRRVGAREYAPVRADEMHRRREGRKQNPERRDAGDRKSTRLNSSHVEISYAVCCLKKKTLKWRSRIRSLQVVLQEIAQPHAPLSACWRSRSGRAWLGTRPVTGAPSVKPTVVPCYAL